MKIDGIKVAGWAETEFRRKMRAEWDHHFFGHIRGAFILLLFAALLVFIHNHQVEVQRAAAAGIQEAAKKINTSDKLREQALKHEKDVDQINQ